MVKILSGVSTEQLKHNNDHKCNPCTPFHKFGKYARNRENAFDMQSFVVVLK